MARGIVSEKHPLSVGGSPTGDYRRLGKALRGQGVGAIGNASTARHLNYATTCSRQAADHVHISETEITRIQAATPRADAKPAVARSPTRRQEGRSRAAEEGRRAATEARRSPTRRPEHQGHHTVSSPGDRRWRPKASSSRRRATTPGGVTVELEDGQNFRKKGEFGPDGGT